MQPIWNLRAFFTHFFDPEIALVHKILKHQEGAQTQSDAVHAFSFISNMFISNTILKFTYSETKISENIEN